MNEYEEIQFILFILTYLFLLKLCQNINKLTTVFLDLLFLLKFTNEIKKKILKVKKMAKSVLTATKLPRIEEFFNFFYLFVIISIGIYTIIIESSSN